MPVSLSFFYQLLDFCISVAPSTILQNFLAGCCQLSKAGQSIYSDLVRGLQHEVVHDWCHAPKLLRCLQQLKSESIIKLAVLHCSPFKSCGSGSGLYDQGRTDEGLLLFLSSPLPYYVDSWVNTSFTEPWQKYFFWWPVLDFHSSHSANSMISSRIWWWARECPECPSQRQRFVLRRFSAYIKDRHA